LGELAERFSGEVLGEITIVVAGAAPVAVDATPEELARLVAVREQAGEPRKEAIAGVAQELGVPKRAVYDAVVSGKTAEPD
jgi:16S rRNA (cytidine1402-2'-O)-methyltransferase